MNFFQHQDLARRQTRRLVWLFVVAVLLITLSVNVLGWWLWQFFMRPLPLPNYFFTTHTAVVLGIILGGSWVEIWRLRAGGAEVARMIGARRVHHEKASFEEKRLLNIVEEMALASSITPPAVYVMDSENAINAFAAGYHPNQAVVAVSRGALDYLNRDELQGVVAHEFSHILNGDMRLNIHLIGVVYGLLLVSLLGKKMISGVRHADGDSAKGIFVLAIVGAVLWGVGYIGVFFGRVIKAAISRQREFLADASAVQFTRNRDGIGGALRKIAGLDKTLSLGSRINHHQAETLSHLFLGAARVNFASGWLATHPPLNERLKRMYGRAVSALAVEAKPMLAQEPAPTLAPLNYEAAAAFAGWNQPDYAAENFVQPQNPSPAHTSHTASAAAQVLANIGSANPAATTLNQNPWFENLHDPLTAQASVLALVAAPDAAQFAEQKRVLSNDLLLAFNQAQQKLQDLPLTLRLSLVEQAIPALRTLDTVARDEFLRQLDHFITADQRITLAEFVLQTLLTRRLANAAQRLTPVKFHAPEQLAPQLTLLLSLFAHVSSKEEATQKTTQQSRNAQQRLDSAAQVLNLRLSLTPATQLGFRAVLAALDQINQLAPLQKPAVIKALVSAGLNSRGQFDPGVVDLMRSVCAALDCPLPPLVETAH